MNGTPKTLRQAIRNGLTTAPLSELEDSVLAHVKDFLAQRFGAAILNARHSPELTVELDELHKLIVRDFKDFSQNG